jgi:hypothetical protein
MWAGRLEPATEELRAGRLLTVGIEVRRSVEAAGGRSGQLRLLYSAAVPQVYA